ncbi:aminopeptidase [Candidatus Woesebacteria bacterium]|nr:aminopeptidase [Candidatus Woesebacteria bacterium]
MYSPSPEILKKYADVLIHFALWSGEGVKKGDVVYLQVPESAKPILIPLQTAVLEAGAHPIIHYIPEGGISRNYFERATMEQITWQPQSYLLERIKTITHVVSILSESDKFELKGVDSEKIMAAGKSAKFYMDARHDKENAGQLTWVLGLFGTQAMADEAKLGLEEYWNEIIQACFLDKADPIAEWQRAFVRIEKTRTWLNDMKIESVHVEGPDIDLHVKLGSDRNWLGGSGRNIPSFELFISPDWRGTNGRVKFNQPLYRYGNLITGIELEFKDGLVISSKATQNEKLLKDMIAVEGANKIGEYSLTDRRLSRITHFMAETLFDENMGGPFGNTHLALGMSYRDSFTGDLSKVSEKEWQERGFNDSSVHTDIISTTDRTVTATLPSGKKQVIYRDGMFTL